MSHALFALSILLFVGAEHDDLALRAEAAVSSGGMVATVHPLATEAGVAVLKSQGNAVDAAIAAALTLGVVDGHNSGIGGGCFILIRTHDGRVAAIDGRETAPGKARPDMFLREGKPLPDASQTGPLAVAVPGALMAYEKALQDYGRKTLTELLPPAAQIAESGFPIDRIYARNIRQSREAIAKFPATAALLLPLEGAPLREGDRLQQPDLARTYRAIAEHGIDWFYRGPFARQCGEWMNANGGILAAEDFAGYQVVEREPLRTTYRQFTIWGFPPPSSGGIHVAQILNTLEPFDLQTIHRNDYGQFVHVVAETMKLAFADRAHWLGDPDFARVPRGLAAADYGRELAKRVDLNHSTPVPSHGTPPDHDREVFGKHTTHISAVDDSGNWVSITATINTSFGSKVVVPGTGVFLNNQMDDFSIEPGVPNAFGLIGAEANAIAPGKRPLSSMSPTIVMSGDRPIMTLGAAGGPTIISQVALVLIQRLELDRPLEVAVSGSRFHHQWRPDELVVEDSMPDSVIRQLEARGHQVKKRPSIAVLQAIEMDVSRFVLRGVHDPRVPGKAAGERPLIADRATRQQIATRILSGEWPMDRLSLKDGRILQGLKLTQAFGEVEFAEIIRKPGRPISVVVRPITIASIDAEELLPDIQRRELFARYDWIRSRARTEAGRMEQITFDNLDNKSSDNKSSVALHYAGPWFDLVSTIGDEPTRRAVVRLEQVLRAYRQLILPRRTPERRLSVQLYGTSEEFQSKLANLAVNFQGPAFYSIPTHTIVAGTDVASYNREWAKSSVELESRRQYYEQLQREFSTRLGGEAQELRTAGIAESKIREEMRSRRKLWSDEYQSAIGKIREAELLNTRRYDEITKEMFRRLYHESFHAYIEDFVFPDGRQRFPRWLNEGLAQICETGQLEDGTLRLDAPDPERLKRLQHSIRNSPLSLVDLITARDRAFAGTHLDWDSDRHYLYAWGLAYYLAFQFQLLSGDGLDVYVTAAGGPDDPIERLEALVGMPLQTFESDWRQYILALRPKIK